MLGSNTLDASRQLPTDDTPTKLGSKILFAISGSNMLADIRHCPKRYGPSVVFVDDGVGCDGGDGGAGGTASKFDSSCPPAGSSRSRLHTVPPKMFTPKRRHTNQTTQFGVARGGSRQPSGCIITMAHFRPSTARKHPASLKLALPYLERLRLARPDDRAEVDSGESTELVARDASDARAAGAPSKDGIALVVQSALATLPP